MARTLILLLAICIGAPIVAFVAAGLAAGVNFIPVVLMFLIFGSFLVGALFEIKRLVDEP